jgi:hypothetical protein
MTVTDQQQVWAATAIHNAVFRRAVLAVHPAVARHPDDIVLNSVKSVRYR